MPKPVTSGALLACSFGAAPSALGVLPNPITPGVAGGQPMATIMDTVPMLNIKPFGLCSSPSYPPTAAATAAAMGALTPTPCMPNVPGPWMPGSQVLMIGGKKALLDNCKAICAFGGQISITMPGQFVADAKF